MDETVHVPLDEQLGRLLLAFRDGTLSEQELAVKVKALKLSVSDSVRDRAVDRAEDFHMVEASDRAHAFDRAEAMERIDQEANADLEEIQIHMEKALAV